MIFEFEECSNADITHLKQCRELEMSWIGIDSCDTDYLILRTYKVICNTKVVAVIAWSYDRRKVMIDEFEVIKSQRGCGVGKAIIDSFVSQVNCDIEILAKNEMVVSFWEKCGFKRGDVSMYEIPMKYVRRDKNCFEENTKS